MLLMVLTVTLAWGQGTRKRHTSEECIAWNVNQNQTSQPSPTSFDTFFSQFILDPICVPNQQAPLAVIDDNTSDSSPILLFKRPFYSQKTKLYKGSKYLLFYMRRAIMLL